MSPSRKIIAMQETMSAWFCTMNSWLSTGGFLLLFLRIAMAGRELGAAASPLPAQLSLRPGRGGWEEAAAQQRNGSSRRFTPPRPPRPRAALPPLPGRRERPPPPPASAPAGRRGLRPARGEAVARRFAGPDGWLRAGRGSSGGATWLWLPSPALLLRCPKPTSVSFSSLSLAKFSFY